MRVRARLGKSDPESPGRTLVLLARPALALALLLVLLALLARVRSARLSIEM
jgi:hypothetical protein